MFRYVIESEFKIVTSIASSLDETKVVEQVPFVIIRLLCSQRGESLSPRSIRLLIGVRHSELV